eukprot:CAMPEP_0176153672 /NCGR_PEP_ID=MMETSP0120_2-20121206/78501_1 /TAXON_ID=160619 /ORGANISM="Kryptoperidinium foliaceum, Strain CCMP 1326" /LENGTH=78 /DNA_ID=CAMNT_0017490735 /DNA_START=29 /DNA_END=261 /DNA_ORIENTATION=-
MTGNSSEVSMFNEFMPTKKDKIEFLQSTICDQVRDKVEKDGSAKLKIAAKLAPILLAPPTALPEPELLMPAIDWGDYP